MVREHDFGRSPESDRDRPRRASDPGGIVLRDAEDVEVTFDHHIGRPDSPSLRGDTVLVKMDVVSEGFDVLEETFSIGETHVLVDLGSEDGPNTSHDRLHRLDRFNIRKSTKTPLFG